MRILYAEDDVETERVVRGKLEAAGHDVEVTTDGEEALAWGGRAPFDVAVLDRLLPRMDGLSVLRRWREAGVGTPVLMLTALGDVRDRVEGLQAGADDYLVKPFASMELLARVGALGRRRTAPESAAVLCVGKLTLDVVRRDVRRAGRGIRLMPREFRILELLMRHAGRPVTRTMLLEEVWGYRFDPGTNIVESHVSRMRAKLNEGWAADPVETLRGVGYRLRTDV